LEIWRDSVVGKWIESIGHSFLELGAAVVSVDFALENVFLEEMFVCGTD